VPRAVARYSADPCCSFTAPMNFELFTQVMHVILDRRRLYPQFATDLLVRQATFDQLRNLQLAPR
jgi:hypothetical protein